MLLRKSGSAAATLIATAIASVSSLPAARAASTAQLIVVHGLPGQDIGQPPSLPVDVLVNGSTCLLKGFTFGSIAGPVSLPAGRYQVAISLANASSPCSNKAVINAAATLAGGSLSAIVAALSPKGAPTADLFAVQNASIPQGTVNYLNANASSGRVTFKVSDNIGNGYSLPLGPRRSENTKDFGPAGSYTLSLTAAGGFKTKSFTFKQKEQGEALLFAVGSAKSGSLTALIKELQFK